MTLRTILRVVIGLCTVAGLFVVVSVASPGKAAAGAPLGCGLLAPVNNSNSDPNCFHQTYDKGGFTTCTVGNTYGSNSCESAGASQATLKKNFIGDLQWYANNGQPYQKISAHWIEGQLGGSDWAQRINEPNVTLQFVTNWGFTRNSEYVPNSNSSGYVYYPYSETSTAKWAILIKVNGVIFDSIKLDCGNMVDSSKPLPNPSVDISGRVWNWTTGQNYSGMKIQTCIAGQPYVYTDSSGMFTIKNVPVDSGFCVRMASATPTDMTGPNVRPWGSGYGSSCPGFGSSKTSPLVGGKNYCTETSYEYQKAGETVSNGYDRNQDWGYDIVFVLPPPVPSCAFLNVTPTTLDPSTVYKVNAGISYQNATETSYVISQGSKLFIDVTGPGVNYTNGDVPKTQSGATLSGTVTPGPTNNMGDYSVKYGITGTGAITCNSSFYVTKHPVTSTFGGDVDAGSGMSIGGVDCAVPADPEGGLVGWNLGSSGNFVGAGTQYAAYVLNHLQDYASAQDGSGGGPGTSSDPTKMAFANNGSAGINVPSGLYGGQFGGGTACIRDYFANATNVQFGNVTINGQTIANDTSQAVYVKGNVYITGDIKFSGSYPKTSDIPSYDVIVEGNIYVAPGVHELDGLYVAEPTTPTTGGIIYTCAPSPFTAQALDSSLYNNCGANALSFNGAVVARQLHLLRAAGNLTGAAAESFNFTPEIWLTIPPDAVSGGGAAGSYDAVTSLPPVL